MEGSTKAILLGEGASEFGSGPTLLPRANLSTHACKSSAEGISGLESERFSEPLAQRGGLRIRVANEGSPWAYRGKGGSDGGGGSFGIMNQGGFGGGENT